MEISDQTFYVASIEDEMHLYAGEDEAIDYLKENANGIDPENDDISVSKVTVDGEDWTIKQMPWQQIALRLIQEA